MFPILRRAFLAGLLVVVPAAVTLWVLAALVQLLDSGIWLVPRPLQPEQPFFRTLLGVSLAILLVIVVGLATRSYLGAQAVRAWEGSMARVPVLSSVYLGVKQLLEAVFTADRNYFEQAVMVEWPRKGVYAVGFETGAPIVVEGRKMVQIFMPTAPNPTTGFYFMIPVDEVTYTSMSVEEAFKLIVSAGIVQPSVPLPIASAMAKSARQLQASSEPSEP